MKFLFISFLIIAVFLIALSAFAFYITFLVRDDPTYDFIFGSLLLGLFFLIISHLVNEEIKKKKRQEIEDTFLNEDKN